MKDPGNKLIATDSLSTLIAAMNKKETEIPKTRIIRKLLRQEGEKKRYFGSLATHSKIIKHEPPPESPFCNTRLTTDDFLWACQETEEEWNRSNDMVLA
jgi:hypothetical protein